MPAEGDDDVLVFDLRGHAVAQKRRQYLQAGNPIFVVDIGHFRPGLYIRRFRIGDTVQEHLIHRLAG